VGTAGEGVPQFLPPLDGHARDQRVRLQTGTARRQPLPESGETAGGDGADRGISSSETRATRNPAGVRGVSRVPETSTAAQALVAEAPAGGQRRADGTRQWRSRGVQRPQGAQRWLGVRSQDGAARARATGPRQAGGARPGDVGEAPRAPEPPALCR
jgi:hypothetical protein